MDTSTFTCTHCSYEVPLYLFENMPGGMLKCKRCRSLIPDPYAFSIDKTYADCNSRRVVTRFPFQMNGKNTIARVRADYIALLAGNDGTRCWLSQGIHPITDMVNGFQLYYVCLSPQIMWGIRDIDGFGAYGVAHLSISQEYAESFFSREGNIQQMEEHLKTLTVKKITDYSRPLVEKGSTALLHNSDGYINILGTVDAGVSLTKIRLKGYREADIHPVTLSLHTTPDIPEPEKLAADTRKPMEKASLPKRDYRIENGVEEVFIRNDGSKERHKAGELITTSTLNHVAKRFRFFEKQFDFVNGWGIYNQTSSRNGYYAAHGTISFYIDNTVLLSALAIKPKGWDAFSEEFFSNVLKKELSSALGTVLKTWISEKGFDTGKISNYLSAMSVDMTLLLNGELNQAHKPAFRQHGLRVKRIDIDHLDFYDSRR